MSEIVDAVYRARGKPPPGDFIPVGVPILDSAVFTEAVYYVFLHLLAESYGNAPELAKHFHPSDVVALTRNGLYFPCVRRLSLSGAVDQRNDGLPDYAAIASFDGRDLQDRFGFIEFYQVRRVGKFPRGVASLAPGPKYKANFWWRDEKLNRAGRRLHGSEDRRALICDQQYFTVAADDRIVPAHMMDRRCNGPAMAGLRGSCAMWAALTLNVSADRRHLWNVTTREEIVSGILTPLTLGVEEGHVKSLFYARSLPVTESGRKRPILHWVQAHERRLREGIEVDVRRHLRGISGFDMDGLHFDITSPDKDAMRGAA